MPPTLDARSPHEPDDRKAAVEGLYEEHKDEVFAFLVRLVGDAALAEDLLHESFLRVHASFERYDAARPFRPWLYRIVRNTAQSALRKKKAASIGEAVERAKQSDRILGDLTRRESVALAEAALASLDDEERSLLIQRHGLDMKLVELAESLECTERTVTNRLRSAAEKFTQAWVARTAKGGRS
jgi:RNA polymerase sigma-70 factor (ECF subfamily)